jgi:hypothetical protein
LGHFPSGLGTRRRLGARRTAARLQDLTQVLDKNENRSPTTGRADRDGGEDLDAPAEYSVLRLDFVT